MFTIELSKKEFDLKQFIKRSALETDYSNLIKEDCIITNNNIPIILYKKLELDTTQVRNAVKTIKYTKEIRTAGLKTESRIFGFNPRNTIRKDYCSATSLAYENPKHHYIICEFGKYLSELYKEYFPDIYNNHKAIVDSKIMKEWKIENTPFTSGIINKNNPLKYHFDTGNIKNVLSNMIVFKKDVLGGYLACPEFDIAFEASNNTVILFNGQNILHGVTPIRKLNSNSYRFSIVYYTLEQIWNCLPINEEIIRARKVHLKREKERSNIKVTDLQTSKSKKGKSNF